MSRPDILGVNYYVTSERFLDHKVQKYSPHLVGGNEQQRYVDLEAVRVKKQHIAGIKNILYEAWQRYHQPLAITEAHIGCSREEQMRWLHEEWKACSQLHKKGIPIRALTVWSLLGAYDWNNLLTKNNGYYEPGAFDLRSDPPRPTAIARYMQQLSNVRLADHPVLSKPGWWRRKDRFIYPPQSAWDRPAFRFRQMRMSQNPVLILGATGTLGSAFARICEERGIVYKSLTRAEADITLPETVDACITHYQPWAIINAIGYVKVDEAEQDAEVCRMINTEGVIALVQLCRENHIRLVTFSSDLVFDGEKRVPYVEHDTISPLNVYGTTKAEAERTVLSQMPEALVIRTSAFFSNWDRYNFATKTLKSLAEKKPVRTLADVIVSPTYIPDLVNVVLDLLIDGEKGIWHVANRGDMSWTNFAYMLADASSLSTTYIEPVTLEEAQLAAPRPYYSALASEKGILMPPIDDAIYRYMQVYQG